MDWEPEPNVMLHGGACKNEELAESEKGCWRDHGEEISQKEKKQAVTRQKITRSHKADAGGRTGRGFRSKSAVGSRRAEVGTPHTFAASWGCRGDTDSDQLRVGFIPFTVALKPLASSRPP